MNQIFSWHFLFTKRFTNPKIMTKSFTYNIWLAGKVVKGDGRGRLLGFPTANLVLEKNQPIPAQGIYACWAKLSDKTYQAVLHVGPRPTFPGATSTVEVHLLDFPDQDLYGQKISFQCVQKIRDIAKFNSTTELSKAIMEDCREAKRILNQTKKP